MADKIGLSFFRARLGKGFYDSVRGFWSVVMVFVGAVPASSLVTFVQFNIGFPSNDLLGCTAGILISVDARCNVGIAVLSRREINLGFVP